MNDAELSKALEQFLTDPASRRDPYPFYQKIRAADPVHRAPDGTWWVTNYEGCVALTRDRRWSHENPAAMSQGEGGGRAKSMIQQMILFRNPPDHTRLRTLLGRVFVRPAAERKREEFRHHIDQVLDDAAGQDFVDFREKIARQIPMFMICDVLGLPQARYEELVDWSLRYASMLDVGVTPAMEKHADEGFAEFGDYIAPILAERRRNPQADLLSEWVAAEERGELAADEIPSFALFTLTGGHGSTTMTMTNALYTLNRHPDQWQRLIDDPSLKVTMVDEVLRYESAGRAFVPRWASEDIELCGKTIPQGAMVIGIESAANRDPSVFDDPEKFDIGRKPNPHLAFGGGIHICPGQFVARVEIQELMAAIAERYPDIEVGEPDDWSDDWILRGLKNLPVRLGARELVN